MNIAREKINKERNTIIRISNPRSKSNAKKGTGRRNEKDFGIWRERIDGKNAGQEAIIGRDGGKEEIDAEISRRISIN